jgi:hypothetical protein
MEEAKQHRGPEQIAFIPEGTERTGPDWGKSIGSWCKRWEGVVPTKAWQW